MFGQILAAVVAVAVAALVNMIPVVGQYLAPYAANIAQQGVLIATGNQHGFNWKSLASVYVQQTLFGFPTDPIGAMVANAGTQFVSQKLGLQKGFNWAGVAAAGITAGVSEGLNSAFGTPASNVAAIAQRVAINGATLIASSAATSVITGQNFGDTIMAALPSVIGQTIGDIASSQIQGAFHWAKDKLGAAKAGYASDEAKMYGLAGKVNTPPRLDYHMAELLSDNKVTNYTGEREARLAASGPAADEIRAAIASASPARRQELLNQYVLSSKANAAGPSLNSSEAVSSVIPAWGTSSSGGPLFPPAKTDPTQSYAGFINGNWFFGGITAEQRPAYGQYLIDSGYVPKTEAGLMRLLDRVDQETMGNDGRLDLLRLAFSEMASMSGANPLLAMARDGFDAISYKHALDYGNRSTRTANEVMRPLEIFSGIAATPILLMGVVEGGALAGGARVAGAAGLMGAESTGGELLAGAATRWFLTTSTGRATLAAAAVMGGGTVAVYTGPSLFATPEGDRGVVGDEDIIVTGSPKSSPPEPPEPPRIPVLLPLPSGHGIITRDKDELDIANRMRAEGRSDFEIQNALEARRQGAVAAEGAASEIIQLSKARFGHTFTTHGQDMTDFLTKRAAGSGMPQGQFLDDQAAARFILENAAKAKGGPVSLPIPKGLPARVIMPDGSFGVPTTIRLVPGGKGVKTAYPEL